MLTPYIGARWERGESVRPDSFATGGPWSFSGRHDREDMLRAESADRQRNDRSRRDRRAHRARRERHQRDARALEVEMGGFSPKFGSADGGSRSFAQATFDGRIAFLTFGTQSLQLDGHAVVTRPGISRTSACRRPVGTVLVTTTEHAAPTMGVRRRPGEHSHDQHAVARRRRAGVSRRPIQHPDRSSPAPARWTAGRHAARGARRRRHRSGGRRSRRRPACACRLSAVYAEYLFDPARRHGFFGVGLSLTLRPLTRDAVHLCVGRRQPLTQLVEPSQHHDDALLRITRARTMRKLLPSRAMSYACSTNPMWKSSAKRLSRRVTAEPAGAVVTLAAISRELRAVVQRVSIRRPQRLGASIRSRSESHRLRRRIRR